MKKSWLIGVVLSGFVLAMATSGFAADAVLDQILKAGKIKVSTDANYAPHRQKFGSS